MNIQLLNLDIGKKWNRKKKEDELFYTEENDEPILNYILLLLLNEQFNENGINFLMKLLNQVKEENNNELNLINFLKVLLKKKIIMK